MEETQALDAPVDLEGLLDEDDETIQVIACEEAPDLCCDIELHLLQVLCP